MIIQRPFRFAFLAILFGITTLAPLIAQAQSDRYAVVEAADLADNPQRYWSRGVVVEDHLVKISGGRERIGDRRFTPIETKTMGRAYVRERLVEDLEEGSDYVFTGTVLSRTGRHWVFWTKTRYFITFDAVKRSRDDVAEAADLFLTGNSDRPAVAHLQEAVARAQKLLVAHAEDQGASLESLIDQDMFRTDKAAEVSRVAVRTMEQELGMTSSEIMSLFIREILVLPYVQARYEKDRKIQFEEEAEEIKEPDVSLPDEEPEMEMEVEVEVEEVTVDDAPEEAVEVIINPDTQEELDEITPDDNVSDAMETILPDATPDKAIQSPVRRR